MEAAGGSTEVGWYFFKIQRKIAVTPQKFQVLLYNVLSEGQRKTCLLFSFLFWNFFPPPKLATLRGILMDREATPTWGRSRRRERAVANPGSC